MDLENPKVKDLNIEHEEYKRDKDLWTKLTLLYEGEETFRKARTQFLHRRPKEMNEVYESRLNQSYYQNILGTGMGFYRAAIFKNPLTVITVGVDKDGKSSVLKEEDEDPFYVAFRKNCDKSGTELIDFMRELFIGLALFRKTYVLMDVKAGTPGQTLADQKAAGIVDKSGKPAPYLLYYGPLQVINWGIDDLGNLTWALVHYQDVRTQFLQKQEIVDVWYYYDPTGYRKYEYARTEEEIINGRLSESATASLVSSGPHCLTKVGQMPLVRFDLTATLWLGNRIKDPVIDHFNADNAYSWALRQSCLAMPVINTDSDIIPVLSEVGFIKIPLDARYGWSEPEGKSFERMEIRVKELREEIYRLMYLQAQGRTSTATAASASAVSKEADMLPATEVMNEYGDIIRAATQRLLDLVAVVRADTVTKFDVRGMKFGKTSTIEDIQKTEGVLALSVPSDTFQKNVMKQAAAEFLPDMNVETSQKVMQEIDAAPSQSELQAKQSELLKQGYAQQMQKAAATYTTKITNNTSLD